MFLNNIALVGNSNVGKTTFYNILTNKKEHTGNWAGKTVDIYQSNFNFNGSNYKITDLPGISSLSENTLEERCTIDYIKNENDDIILFLDGTNIKKGLYLYFKLKELTDNILVIVTMKDILDKTSISMDIAKLEMYIESKVLFLDLMTETKNSILTKLDNIKSSQFENNKNKISFNNDNDIIKYCDEIYKDVMSREYKNSKISELADDIILNRYCSIPILFICSISILLIVSFFCGLFQEILIKQFTIFLFNLETISRKLGVSNFIIEIIINGGLYTLLFVASVMVPTLIIFFPLFSMIEEMGIIPRIVFNLDGIFSKFYLSGKSAISILLGFGCNCIGVTSTRILENEKSRKIAILTNNFIPCGGRLPMMFILTFTFLSGGVLQSMLIILIFITINIFILLSVSYMLGKIYKCEQEQLVYELPLYKKPNIKNILRNSILGKALPVLVKSLYFSFVAGVLIMFLGLIKINDITILEYIIKFLNPLGRLMGLSGIILFAFVVGIAANEIVLPIILLLYSNASIFLDNDISVLSEYGFSYITVICMIIFSFNHYPCIASLFTIKKETNSTIFTFMCAIVPTLIGVLLCILTNIILLSLQNFLFF